MEIEKRWTQPIQNWGIIFNQFIAIWLVHPWHLIVRVIKLFQS